MLCEVSNHVWRWVQVLDDQTRNGKKNSFPPVFGMDKAAYENVVAALKGTKGLKSVSVSQRGIPVFAGSSTYFFLDSWPPSLGCRWLVYEQRNIPNTRGSRWVWVVPPKIRIHFLCLKMYWVMAAFLTNQIPVTKHSHFADAPTCLFQFEDSAPSRPVSLLRRLVSPPI